MSLTVGTRVWFAGEKRPFDVQAVSASGRFVVCRGGSDVLWALCAAALIPQGQSTDGETR